MSDVVTQIERAIDAQRLTLTELARRVGHRQPSALCRMLKREHEPGEELLQALATALGVELIVPAVPERRIRPASHM